jgi:putative membrane protein
MKSLLVIPQGTIGITDCNQLNETELKEIGEELMEQMMGHEAHEAMEEAMGPGLSELMDLRMGSMYTGCGEYTGYGMMGMPTMMGGWNWPFSWGMMGYGWLYWLVILGLIVIGAWWLFKPKESALEILKKRYASGEISSKEFKKMKKELL